MNVSGVTTTDDEIVVSLADSLEKQEAVERENKLEMEKLDKKARGVEDLFSDDIIAPTSRRRREKTAGRDTEAPKTAEENPESLDDLLMDL
jgi:hypothetical protein